MLNDIVNVAGDTAVFCTFSLLPSSHVCVCVCDVHSPTGLYYLGRNIFQVPRPYQIGVNKIIFLKKQFKSASVQNVNHAKQFRGKLARRC